MDNVTQHKKCNWMVNGFLTTYSWDNKCFMLNKWNIEKPKTLSDGKSRQQNQMTFRNKLSLLNAASARSLQRGKK